MAINWVAILKFAVPVVTTVASVATSFVQKNEMNKTIAKEVEKALKKNQ